MNLQQARFVFRQRTPWEAVDLGRHLINAHPTYYFGLYACFMLPFVLLGSLLLHESPIWLMFLIWWLKPLYEYGTLSALSIQAFQPLPPFKQALTTGFKLMWRRCVWGDLIWRRLSPTRSFSMPIPQLENVHGKDQRLRQRELSRYGSGTATGLTFIGNALEQIWLYALLVMAYWFLYGNFIQQGLVQPNQMNEISGLFVNLYESWVNQESSSFFNYSNLAYYITLIFWGPYYVAGGFTLYLNARIQSEGWDIRLVWQQLGERLRQTTSWCVALCSSALISLMLLAPPSGQASTLPDEQSVSQHREAALQQSPFYHVETKNQWCWGSCDDNSSPPVWTPDVPSESGTILKTLGYVVLALLLAAVVYLLWRWLKTQSFAKQQQATDAPTTLFGLDVRSDSLPKDVSHQAKLLLNTNPRAALSLLYRASLAQLINSQQLPIKQHHTEGRILQLVTTQLPMLNEYFQHLTSAWLQTAYGHQQLPIDVLNELCDLYANHFESRR